MVSLSTSIRLSSFLLRILRPLEQGPALYWIFSYGLETRSVQATSFGSFACRLQEVPIIGTSCLNFPHKLSLHFYRCIGLILTALSALALATP